MPSLTGLRALVTPGCPLLLLCLLASTRPDRAESNPAGAWGSGARPGRALGTRDGGASAATLQPEGIACCPGKGRVDAGAGGCRAERRWPLIGWARVTQGRNVGAGVAPRLPSLGLIPAPIQPSLIPETGTERGSVFSLRSGLIEPAGSCGGYWDLHCGVVTDPHSLRPTPSASGLSKVLVSPFLLAGAVGLEDVF